MRVIAGSAKRIRLKAPEGIETRPTTDRIKETLFNIIAPDIYDCRFLDMFSGSGAIGIEALSRGASQAVFVESSKKAVSCIRENLIATKLNEQAIILHMDVFRALKRLEGQGTFDYIFMDPPYNQQSTHTILEYLAKSNILEEHSIIIVETDIGTDLSYSRRFGYTVWKSKEYKTNKHVFLLHNT